MLWGARAALEALDIKTRDSGLTVMLDWFSRRCSPGLKDTMGETRKLAAIMAVDVVGYSRLMGEDEAGTAKAVREHRKAAAPIVADLGGRVVKTMGDGVLLEFPSVVSAVECAVTIQNMMVARNVDTPEARRIVYRIGVHLGDVLIDGDDILGEGVNIAARLESICEPGRRLNIPGRL